MPTHTNGLRMCLPAMNDCTGEMALTATGYTRLSRNTRLHLVPVVNTLGTETAKSKLQPEQLDLDSAEAAALFQASNRTAFSMPSVCSCGLTVQDYMYPNSGPLGFRKHLLECKLQATAEQSNAQKEGGHIHLHIRFHLQRKIRPQRRCNISSRKLLSDLECAVCMADATYLDYTTAIAEWFTTGSASVTSREFLWPVQHQRQAPVSMGSSMDSSMLSARSMRRESSQTQRK